MITVVGLGNEKGDLTASGKSAILSAVQKGDKIAVRTGKTRSYESVLELGVEHTCLDYVYEKSRSFKTLNDNLAKAVISLGENTVYLVDGSASEDNSVKSLVRKTRGKLKIISGVSKATAIAEKANFKSCSYTAVSAYEIFEKAKGGLALPLLVYDLDDQALASDVKLLLGDVFGDEIKGKYIIGNTAKVVGMYELDRQKAYDYSSAFAIDEVDLLDKKRFNLEDLIEIIARLRAPDGCPWDRAQTPESVKMSVIEEAYELVDAIDSGDSEKVLEETGDVMLQAVFQAVMREERGEFTMTDALTNLCEKLIFRHSHVFGKDNAKDEQSALGVWEKNKMQEKHQTTFADSVNDVPKAFPAALRAQKIGKRAAKAGLDFAAVIDAVQALKSEIEEFLTAYKKGDNEEIEKELGDVLFSAVNVGRKADCDTEKALKESADRFAKRFTVAEKLAILDGKTVTKLSQEEWDSYYRLAKSKIEKGETDNA